MSLNINEFKKIKTQTNYALQNANYEDLYLNTTTLDGLNHVFSNTIDGTDAPQIQDQHNTGTCWIHAGISICKRILIKKLKLEKSFTLSTNHLIFWDKMERANYFINYIISNPDKECEGVVSLLRNPLYDGGNWEQFVILATTYGLVPEEIGKPRYSSKSTKGLNKLIKSKLREFASKVINTGVNLDLAKEYRITIYKLLCSFMGQPKFPDSPITWTYLNGSGKKCVITDLTPETLYSTYIDNDDLTLNNFITIIHDPRPQHPYNKVCIRTNDTYGTSNVPMLNLSITKIIPLIISQLDKGIPVWFSCDVSYFISHTHNFMDMNLYDYPFSCSMNKADRLDFYDSTACHAMAIIGYDLEDRIGKNKKDEKQSNKRAKISHESSPNNVVKFMVENSWGKYGNHNGIYAMSTNWLEMFCYEFIINKEFIDDKTLRMWDKPLDPIYLDDDDPFC